MQKKLPLSITTQDGGRDTLWT